MEQATAVDYERYWLPGDQQRERLGEEGRYRRGITVPELGFLTSTDNRSTTGAFAKEQVRWGASQLICEKSFEKCKMRMAVGSHFRI